MILKVKKVDHDGYNGREYHPEERHVGLEVRVVGLEVVHFSAQTAEITNLRTTAIFGESRRADLVMMLADEGNQEQVFIAYTPNGERLELMAHEVEFISL